MRATGGNSSRRKFSVSVSATLHNSLPSAEDWSAQSSNGTITVALARGPTNVYARSTNSGVSWTSRTMPSTEDWQAVAWNGSVFCAIAQNTASCWTSPDGITWTARTMPAALAWVDLLWNGTVFCAIAQGSANCATSPDGITWTARTMPASTNWWKVAASGSVLVAIALSTSTAARSTNNGATWTSATLPGPQDDWSLIATAAGFLAIGIDAVYASSDGGQTWSTLSGSDLPVSMYACVSKSSANIVLAIAADGSYTVSQDGGLTWAAGSSLYGFWAIALISVGAKFYAIESGGTNYVEFTVVAILGTGTTSVPVVVRTVKPGSTQLGVRVNIVPAAILDGSQSVCIGDGVAAVWTAIVTIDGIDVTQQVIADIRIEAEEGAARIAELDIRPDDGTTLEIAGWTGLPVTIDVADNALGSPIYAMRLFTGVIDTPALNKSASTLSLRCTDDLQGRCDGMSNAELYAIIGGYESTAVFDKAASGWSHAQDLLSTVTASLDISAEGDMRLTPWAPKVTPDMTFDESIIGENSLAPSIAARSALVNEVLIHFDYRFPRVKAEGYPVNYHYVTLSNFSAHILAGNWWLQRQQVPAAIRAAGGTVISITYDDLPDYIIPVGAGYFTPSAADADLCMGFAAGVSFDYAQTITEQHRIHVRNQKSIDQIGLRQTTISGALEGVYPDLTAAETGIQRYKEKSSSIPPPDAAAVTLEKTTSADATLTTETDRAAANAAMEALIAVAKAKIWASHRQNNIAATVPLIPALDLDKTIAINADGISARGKIVRVTHRLSANSGEAITEFAIALCSVAGYGITHDSDPTTAPAGTVAGQTDITATVNSVFHMGDTEDHQLVITFPGVAEIERANANPTITSTLAAPLVEDLFTVTI